MSSFKSRLDAYFGFTALGSSLPTEVLAGVGTFLSLAYIFIVNPAIMVGTIDHPTGMNVSGVFFATVIASALSTLFMGLWARLPLALAPGLEMNSFFAVTVVGVLGFTWQEALGAVFWSGLLCILFTVLPVRRAIIDSIPDGLKKAMAVSVGVFVLTIGLFLSHVVEMGSGRIDGFSFSMTARSTALLLGLGISGILGMRRLRFPGGMLVAIVVAAIFCRAQGIVATTPPAAPADFLSAALQVDFVPDNLLGFLPVLLVFFLLDFYGSIGKFIGLTASTNLIRDGKLPRIERAMGVDAVGTVGGALLGTSSIITYVESAVGIGTGGRTGIVAVVCGFLMLASLALTPMVGLVPVDATSGILVYVGYLLMRDTWEERGLVKWDFGVSAAMAIVTFATFSLDKSLLLGFALYTVKMWGNGNRNVVMLASTALLALAVVVPLLLR